MRVAYGVRESVQAGSISEGIAAIVNKAAENGHTSIAQQGSHGGPKSANLGNARLLWASSWTATNSTRFCKQQHRPRLCDPYAQQAITENVSAQDLPFDQSRSRAAQVNIYLYHESVGTKRFQSPYPGKFIVRGHAVELDVYAPPDLRFPSLLDAQRLANRIFLVCTRAGTA